jgi:hypothetical protein
MTRRVELAALTRRELENLLLTEHGALSRVLEAVRENTKPEWKVRREVERIVDEAVDRRPFVVAYARGVEASFDRIRASRNAVRWVRWSEVDA